MILLIGSGGDPHVAKVHSKLFDGGYEAILVDCYDGASRGVDCIISDRASLIIGTDTVAVDQVRSVWWRLKPGFIIPSATVSAYYDYQFSMKEWSHIYDFIAMKLENVCNVNNRLAASRANNKLYQLDRARACGLNTPRTLVSSSISAVIDFIGSIASGGQAIFKTLNPYMNPDGRMTYTSVVTLTDIQTNSLSLTKCGGIFQELVRKRYELRVTIVGSEVFAAKINSQKVAGAEVDWRAEIFSDFYEPCKLEADLQERLLTLHRTLGLEYGAYDLIVDMADEPVFLEVNPGGQWMWIEEKLGYPIAAEMAKLLTRSR